MRNKGLILVLILSLGINAAVLAIGAYQYYCSTGLTPSTSCPVFPKDQHLYQALGLSASQLSRMESMAHMFHARLEKLHSAMVVKKNLLLDFLSQEEVGSGKIEKLRQDMATIRDEIQKEVITHILEVRKVLNAKQREHFFDLLSKSMRRENNWFSKTGGY